MQKKTIKHSPEFLIKWGLLLHRSIVEMSIEQTNREKIEC